MTLIKKKIPITLLIFKRENKQYGFSYIEMMVAMFILAITITPAMEAIQQGVKGASIHQDLTQQHYALVKRMEIIKAEPYENLLNSAQNAGNNTTASSYSDPQDQSNRLLVFLALYDADATPFVLTDPDNDGDSDIYTGDTSNLLWLRVELENSFQKFETLVTR